MAAAHRHRLGYWSAVVVALAAVAAGVVIAVNGYSASGPDAAVSGYFAALQRADAPAALGYGTLPAGPRTLLTSAVLREQRKIAPIGDVRVRTIARQGGTATVAVSYTVGFAGQPQVVTDRVQVHRDGHDWRLGRTAADVGVSLHQAADRAAILGAQLPHGAVAMFPGALPVAFDTPDLRLDPAASVVTLSGRSALAPQVELTGAGRNAVAAAVRSALRTCLSAAAGPRCPVPSDRYVPGSIRGTLSSLGHLTLSVDDDRQGVVDVSGSARVGSASYRALDFDNQPVAHTGTVTLPLVAKVPVRGALIWTGAA